MALLAVLLVVCGYLLGSIPTAVVVARRLGHDPTSEGSGNPGASNVYRVAGAKAAAIVFVGDAAKGAAAAGLGYVVAGRPGAFAGGFASVLGHSVPPWGHRGGKGVATTAGLTWVLFPLAAAVALVVWLSSAKVLGRASIASLIVAVGLPIGLGLWGEPASEVVAMSGLCGFIIVRHAPNIARLRRGEEQGLRADGR